MRQVEEKAARVERKRRTRSCLLVKPATLLLSAGVGTKWKRKRKRWKKKVRNVQETGEEDWSTDPQASSSTQPQARTAPAAKGNEQVRRLVSTPMPIIEEVDNDAFAAKQKHFHKQITNINDIRKPPPTEAMVCHMKL